MKKKSKLSVVRWVDEVHQLHGRDVTIVDIIKATAKGAQMVGRGVSIRNPKDCPIKSDGIKFALQRAIKKAKLGKKDRTTLWRNFFALYPVPPVVKESKKLDWWSFGAAGQGKSSAAARIFSGNRPQDRAGVPKALLAFLRYKPGKLAKYKTPKAWAEALTDKQVLELVKTQPFLGALAVKERPWLNAWAKK